MVQFGKNSPLTISEDAQKHIESIRKAQKHAKTDFLRVKAVVPAFGDTVSFNMFFDDEPIAGDMAYNEGTTKVLLDANTAYLLVGSELWQKPDGELEFSHMDTRYNFDIEDNPIKN